MAAMIDGRIIDKPGIFELGHTVVVSGGIPCACGKCGCLGKYSSQRGLVKRYGKSYDELMHDVEQGNDEATEILNEGIKHLAYAITNAASLLNIGNVILCGSFWNSKDIFWNDFLKYTHELCGNFNVTFSFTGVSSAPLGAALIAEKAALRRIGSSKN
jgi:glucokinase